MARSLIIIYNAPTDSSGWVHVEDYFVSIGVTMKGVHGKLKHWGLLEQKENTDDAKNKNGLWRITELGRDFVEGKVSMNRAVFLYLDRVRDYDDTPVTIFEALGTKFNYAELMQGFDNDLPEMLKRQSGAS